MSQENNELYYMQLSKDHMEMTKWLTNEQRGFLFKLVFAYFCDEMTGQEVIDNVPEEHRIILPIWSNMQISINRSKAAYSEKRRTNKENGKKGGAPKGNQNARKKQACNHTDSREDGEDDDEIETEEFCKEQNRNSTLAYYYQCFSTELHEKGYCISTFFDWDQLVEFMNYYVLLRFAYIICQSYLDESLFFCYQENGFSGFIRIINELGTDKLIEKMRIELFEKEITNERDDGEPNLFDSIEMILSDVAEDDKELQVLLNKR